MKSKFSKDDIEFLNVADEHVKKCFINVIKKYTPLHGHKIVLCQKKLGKTTMQAQPLIDKNFWSRKTRSYKVDCNHQTQVDHPIRIKKLPKDVLEGWFAHEVGHILDYHQRNWFNLMVLGILYLFSKRRIIKAEHQADLYAIEYGFSTKILATKRFILNHTDITQKYKDRILKYYMSPEAVEEAILNHEETILGVEDAKVI